MRRKNQWQIKNIETNETSFFSIEPRSFKKPKLWLKNFIQGSLVVLISVFIIFTVVQAGTITPPSGTPGAQFYTLSEIYTRLTTNATSTVGGHSFTFADSLAGTGRTLTEIYNAIPTIDPTKLLDTATYLGVTGSITTQTLSADSVNVPAGYYGAGNALNVVDVDLAAGNIKKDIAIFGITGTLYGDTDPTKVLTVASATGTYNADNLIAENVKKDITFGVADTGTLAPDGTATDTDCLDTKTFYSGDSWTQKIGSIATQTLSADSDTVNAGYYAATTLHGVDTDLTASNIGANASIFGVAGTLLKNLFTGSDRSDRLSTVTLNTGGSGYTEGAQVLTVTQTGAIGGTVNVTVDAGGVVTSVDSIAITGKGYSVADGLATTGGDGTGATVNITAVASHYPIAVGGVDDHNDNTTIPSDSYQGAWTTCDDTNNYCNTNDSTNADKRDNSTGLVWSKKICDDENDYTQTWFWANNCKYPNLLTGDDGTCDTHGEIACKCVKLTGEDKIGCEDLGDEEWRLPSQKELMQAYINGSWANLSSSHYNYWSATTPSTNNTHRAWRVNLPDGNTYYTTKTNSDGYRVRCVR